VKHWGFYKNLLFGGARTEKTGLCVKVKRAATQGVSGLLNRKSERIPRRKADRGECLNSHLRRGGFVERQQTAKQRSTKCRCLSLHARAEQAVRPRGFGLSSAERLSTGGCKQSKNDKLPYSRRFPVPLRRDCRDLQLSGDL